MKEAKFKKGDIVNFDLDAFQAFGNTGMSKSHIKRSQLQGVVSNVRWDSERNQWNITVLWPGIKTPDIYFEDFLKKVIEL